VDKQLTSQGRKHDWHDTGIKFVAQVITGSISLSLTVSGCSCLTFSREMLKKIFSSSRWSFSTTKKGGGTGVSRYWESCFLLSFHRSNAVTKQGLWCSTYYILLFCLIFGDFSAINRKKFIPILSYQWILQISDLSCQWKQRHVIFQLAVEFCPIPSNQYSLHVNHIHTLHWEGFTTTFSRKRIGFHWRAKPFWTEFNVKTG